MSGGRIQEFFRDKTVLLTGATGFVGSVLLERLLASCQGIKEVYVVVRPRAGLEPEQRKEQLLKRQLFKGLTDELKKKVVVLCGDVGLPLLGLSDTNIRRVQEKVHVVFHVAATINFSSPLSRALAVNVGGTASVIDISRKISNLQALVHVSTAFANCIGKEVILEKVYPTSWSPRELLEIMKNLTPDEVRMKEKEIIGDHPNTYSFTKQLCENLIQGEAGDLPVAIVRPSMVLCTAERPMAGWLENVQTGTFGFIAGASRGVFRTIRVDPNVHGDYVPCDYFTAFLIVAAWRASITRRLEVYHYTSGLDSRLLWSDMVTGVMKNIEKYPTTNAVFYPKAKCRSSPFRNWLVVMLFHYLPAIIIDSMVTINDAPAKILHLQKKYARGSFFASHFTTFDWRFSSENTQSLWEMLDEDDKKEFWFSMDGFDWNKYIKTCVLGVREYYHGQKLSSVPTARFRHNCGKAVYYTLWILFFMALYCIMHPYLSSSAITLLLSTFITIFLYWL